MGRWTGFSQSRPFAAYSGLPIVAWQNEPTNLMSSFKFTLAGTNHQWFMPELQGQRLSLTFDSNGVAQLWLGETNIFQVATAGGNLSDMAPGINHPHGSWNTNGNFFVDGTLDDAIPVPMGW